MKRLITLVLCVILIAMPSGYCEEDFQFAGVIESNILFRGIPWGEPMPNARRYLEKTTNISDFVTFQNHGTSVGDIICGAGSGYDIGFGYSFEGNLGYTDFNWCWVGKDRKDKLSVAGYDVNSVYMYYGFMEKEEGTLEKSPEYAHLYGAKYVFVPKNVIAQYNDLGAKLTEVYGDCNLTANDGSEIFGMSKYGYVYKEDLIEKYTIWYDANKKVMLSLRMIDVRDDNSIKQDSIEISYVWLPADAMLKKAMELDQQSIAGDSTDGL